MVESVEDASTVVSPASSVSSVVVMVRFSAGISASSTTGMIPVTLPAGMRANFHSRLYHVGLVGSAILCFNGKGSDLFSLDLSS